jgi:cytochrome c5
MVCHAAGVAGAPKAAVKTAVDYRFSLVKYTVNGNR